MDKVHQSGVYAALAAVSGGGGFTVISAPIFAGVLFVASAVLFGFAFKPQLAQTRLHLPFRKKRPQLAPDATADHPTAETVRKWRKQLLAAGDDPLATLAYVEIRGYLPSEMVHDLESGLTIRMQPLRRGSRLTARGRVPTSTPRNYRLEQQPRQPRMHPGNSRIKAVSGPYSRLPGLSRPKWGNPVLMRFSGRNGRRNDLRPPRRWDDRGLPVKQMILTAAGAFEVLRLPG